MAAPEVTQAILHCIDFLLCFAKLVIQTEPAKELPDPVVQRRPFPVVSRVVGRAKGGFITYFWQPPFLFGEPLPPLPFHPGVRSVVSPAAKKHP